MTALEIAAPTFKTPDLKLASFLHCRNFEIIGFKWLDGKPITIFPDSPELRYAVSEYSENGVVPVRSFCKTLKKLERVLREHRGDLKADVEN